MRSNRRWRMGISALVAGSLFTLLGPARADAGPCYTVTVHDGSADPPGVTVCPFD